MDLVNRNQSIYQEFSYAEKGLHGRGKCEMGVVLVIFLFIRPGSSPWLMKNDRVWD